MPVILPVPESREVTLDLPEFKDTDQKAHVTVRQATNAEQEYIASEFLNREERVYAADGSMRIYYKYNTLELRRIQAFLTLTDCDLYVPDPSAPDNPDKAVPLFRFQTVGSKRQVSMSKVEFAEAWGKLPPDWSFAISKAIFTVNPQWGYETEEGE